MLVIKNTITNAFFNLASEEYFIDHFDEPVILLWRNDKTVVVGKNQNSVEEVNMEYVRENDITVVRRLTGGGAVFHDLGNLNFSLIQKHTPSLFNDYAHFTRPVCAYLKSLGLDVVLSGRNDLLIEGMKCSGNAQTYRKGRMMHHGTLLFQADVADISGSLRPNPLKIESKSIKSVRSRITNIASHLKKPMTVDAFYDGLYQFFLKNMDDAQEYVFTDNDIQSIQALADEKYSTWNWNYGSSPAYTLRKEQKFDFGIVDLRLTIEKGVIKAVRLFGDFFGGNEAEVLEQSLTGIPYEKNSCEKALDGLSVDDYISGMSREQFLSLLL
jgi:lipoate-protein ligase A